MVIVSNLLKDVLGIVSIRIKQRKRAKNIKNRHNYRQCWRYAHSGLCSIVKSAFRNILNIITVFLTPELVWKRWETMEKLHRILF